MRATEFIITKSKHRVQENSFNDQDAGLGWEEKLMDSWSPRAAQYMATVVKQAFNSLYPDVKLKVWAEDEGVSATTDVASADVKADVFGQYGKKDWECNFFCGPLYNEADDRKYLELMVDDAASGSYPGVWKIIVGEWKKWASGQLQKTGADDVCFSVDQDMSGGAWGKIAGAVGIRFIAHDLDEGVAEGFEQLDIDYYMNEGCGIFAVAKALNSSNAKIYVISKNEGEAWSNNFPYELTHVFVYIPNQGTIDVKGNRTPEQMARDFHLSKNDYSIKGPFSPKEFYSKFMGNSDAKPLYGTKQEINQLQKQLQVKQGVAENFADGKNPGRKGLAKRVGVNCKQPVSKLRNIAKNSTGERQRMAHWCANMKSGKNK